MRKFFVTSRNKVLQDCMRHDVSHVISLVDYDKPVSLPVTFDKDDWLLLNFRDREYRDIPDGPRHFHVERVFEFVDRTDKDARILVHCEAGISRSTAMTLALLVRERGIENLDRCVEILKEIRPIAAPNILIAEIADEIMMCDGKLLKAAVEIVPEHIFKFL